MVLKCLRFIDNVLKPERTMELTIDLKQFYIINEFVNVDKVLESDYLFESYYDSIIINAFSKIHSGQQYDASYISLAESLQSYYRLIILFLALVDFIRKSHLRFNRGSAFEEEFIYTKTLPNIITAKDAFYYLFLLMNILSLRSNIHSVSEFYSEEFVLLNGKYVLEDDYNERFINLNGLLDSNGILSLFEQANKKIANKENRCVALLIYNNRKYLSISGTSQDYDGDIVNNWTISNDYMKVYKQIKTDIINYDCACHLIDSCCGPINFGFYKNDIFSIKRMIQRDYACCERKILAYIPQPFIPKDAQLYVKYIPCEKCIPYLDGMEDIICFDLKDYKRLRKLKKKNDLRNALRKCSISRNIVYLQKEDPDCYIE